MECNMSDTIVHIISVNVTKAKGSVYIYAYAGRSKYRFKQAYTSIEQACFKANLMLTKGTIDLTHWSTGK